MFCKIAKNVNVQSKTKEKQQEMFEIQKVLPGTKFKKEALVQNQHINK